MTSEQWAPISGSPGYDVSDFGRVRSWLPVNQWASPPSVAKIMQPSRAGRGYFLVGLRCRDRGKVARFVHQLVLEGFVGPRPEGMVARHLNGDREDNRRRNLAWGTRLENAADAIKHGAHKCGADHVHAKLTPEDVVEIRQLAARGLTHQAVADRYPVGRTQITRIVRGVRWSHLIDRSET